VALDVVSYATSQDVADKVVHDSTRAGSKPAAIQGDVAKTADVECVLSEAARQFGPIDILVNNGGVCAFSPIESLSEEEFHRHFETSWAFSWRSGNRSNRRCWMPKETSPALHTRMQRPDIERERLVSIAAQLNLETVEKSGMP
jgi:NAD(P)-dependent dehydrogenase (short-subunit alcohol dehydrogenase family)